MFAGRHTHIAGLAMLLKPKHEPCESNSSGYLAICVCLQHTHIAGLATLLKPKHELYNY